MYLQRKKHNYFLRVWISRAKIKVFRHWNYLWLDIDYKLFFLSKFVGVFQPLELFFIWLKEKLVNRQIKREQVMSKQSNLRNYRYQIFSYLSISIVFFPLYYIYVLSWIICFKKCLHLCKFGNLFEMMKVMHFQHTYSNHLWVIWTFKSPLTTPISFHLQGLFLPHRLISASALYNHESTCHHYQLRNLSLSLSTWQPRVHTDTFTNYANPSILIGACDSLFSQIPLIYLKNLNFCS